MNKLFYLTICLLVISCSSGDKNETAATQGTRAKTVPSIQSSSQKTGPVFLSFPPQQAVELIKNRKNLLILDVRSPEELKQGKIKGSVLVPFWDIAKGRYKVPSDRPVLLVCAVGGRSYAVGQYLNKSGYPEVYNLQGGISAWQQARLPLEY